MKKMFEKYEFINWAVKEMEKHLPEDRGAEVEVIQLDLINRSYTGAHIIKSCDGMQMSPIINLDELYDAYSRGMTLEEAGMHIERALNDIAPDFSTCVEDIMSGYAKVKDKLFVRLCDTEANALSLSDAPYVEIANLAMTAHIMVGDEVGVASVPVTYPLLESFGISKEQLLGDALANSVKIMPPTYMPLMSVLSGTLDYKPLDELPESGCTPIVISNEGGIYGASALFYPGVLQKMSEYYGGDFIVLPSSVHEMILMSAVCNEPQELLMVQIVTEINKSDVLDEDKLSDNAYYYDAAEARFMTVREHGARE